MNKISLEFLYKKLFDAQLEKDWYKAEEIRLQIRRIENDIGEPEEEERDCLNPKTVPPAGR